MSIQKLLSIFALGCFASFAATACAATTDDPSSPDDGSSSEAQDEELRKSIQACSVDADCTAVPRGGCCSNGWMEAVNKHHVVAYEHATACKLNPPPMCPMYMVHDTRVPECNTSTKKCEMVAPEDIQCGGFMMNSHACPDGYSCDHTGVNPDLPGKCVKDPPQAPDCRSLGCAAGQWCSACWGKFACIPKGAMC